MRNFGMYSNEIMKKLKNSDEGAYFMPFPFGYIEGLIFVDIKFKNIFPQILRR